MCCQIRDASNSIALDFYIRRHHLADEWVESSELYDSDLVLSCSVLALLQILCCHSSFLLCTARLPNAALAAR